MKKGLLPIVAFLVLFILSTGMETCRLSKQNSRSTKIPYKLFFELRSGIRTNLNSISFINSARGIAVGDNGTILLTKNGGHDWLSVGGLTPLNLYGVAMADSLITIAVGEKGQILRSKDGGYTWDAITSGNTYFLKTLRSVGFYSAKDGYAVGDSGVIFSTHSAGLKWNKMHGNPAKTLNAISYNNGNHPCIVGNNGAFSYSKDLGETWGGASFTKENLRSIHFSQTAGLHSHSDFGFAVGDAGIIFKTTNGGQDWNPDTSHITKNLRGVFLSSSKWAYAVGDSGTVLRYNGNRWELLPPPTTKTINAVDPVFWNPTSTCVGEDGLIMYINPPAVNDGSVATVTGQSGCLWDVKLNTKTLITTDDAGNQVRYLRLEVCSSLEQSDLIIIPGSGWAVRDQYRNISTELEPDHVYPSPPDHNLCTITLQTNPAGDFTSGYFSCYLKDENENFYLLSSYEIQCSE